MIVFVARVSYVAQFPCVASMADGKLGACVSAGACTRVANEGLNVK